MPARTAFDLGEEIRISPPIWPNHELKVQPGDLSQFTPNGNGIYGYQKHDGGNPFTSAPPQEPRGGVIYFDNGISKEDFDGLMRILDIQPEHRKPYKNYAVFTAESEQPGKDGYLTQMRVVSTFGMRFMFNALTDAEYDRFPEQQVGIKEALWRFMQQERKRWGTCFGDWPLNGLFGGDGHYACEQLGFGFMVENDYNNIFRIWSRAWLVTK